MRRTGRKGEAFTLTEVSIAMSVIGFGILGLLHAMASGTRVNAAGRDLTQAMFLAQEIRELTLPLPFRDPNPGDQGNPPGPDGSSPQTFLDDLDDIMGVTYCPPVDAQLNPITELPDWSQVVTLEWVNPDDLDDVVSPGTSDVICVTVSVRHNGSEVLDTSWLVVRRRDE